MSNNKTVAFLAYLLFVPGWLYALLVRRDDAFTQFHARQSLVLNLAAVALLVGWYVLAWIVSWVPVLGPPFAGFAFGIVIAGYLFLIVVWLVGMSRALKDSTQPLFLIGDWAARLPF